MYFIGNPDSIFSIGGLCVIETERQFSDLPRSIMSSKYSLCLTESTLRLKAMQIKLRLRLIFGTENYSPLVTLFRIE